MKKLIVAGILALILIAPFIPSANADPLTLYFISNGIVVRGIQDNTLGDSDNNKSAIEFNGNVGSWSVKITAGFIQSGDQPLYLSIFGSANPLNLTSASTLRIIAAKTDFDIPGSQFNLEASGWNRGPSGSKVSLNAYYGANSLISNIQFGSTAADSLGSFNPGYYSGSATSLFSGAEMYGIATEAVIAYTKGIGPPKVTTLDSKLYMVPEPAILVLLGFGLSGLALTARKWL